MDLLNDIPLLHEVVLVLRCLRLRDTNVFGWLNFTSLQSHLEMREETELGERAENVAKFILERSVLMYLRNIYIIHVFHQNTSKRFLSGLVI